MTIERTVLGSRGATLAFATRPMVIGLDDKPIAGLMGWSAKKVEAIRGAYIDQAATVMAIRQRLSAAAVEEAVKDDSRERPSG